MSLSVHIEKQLGAFHLRADLETDGGITGLLGQSGCGKSYTLKCIAGIERPDSGEIVLNGRTLFSAERGICLPPQKRRVGYLFQNYALFPNMTVEQNILCGLRAEKNRGERKRQLEWAIDLMQLHGLERHRPNQLSGGQAQRTALARILVSRPELLMLDEPFSALDTHLRDKLQMEMKGLLQGFDKDVLLVTHSRDEAYHMCSRLSVMDGGRVSGTRETKALFAEPETCRAAAITGCKNITPAFKRGEYEVEAPEWGLRLVTAKPVPDDISHIGIRAHYFQPNCPQNRQRVEYVSEMEEPFEWIVQFRFSGQTEEAAPVWWRVPKDRRPQKFPEELGIAPANVLLLRE